MESKKASLLVSVAYYGVIAAGIFLLLRYFLPVLFPFIIAFLLSAAFQRPINMLAARFSRIPRRAVAMAVLLMFCVFFGVAFTLIFRSLALQVLEFISTLPSALTELVKMLMERGEQWLSKLPAWLQSTLASDRTSEILLSAVDTLSSPLLNLLSSAGTAAMRLPSMVFVVVITVISTFFITLDYQGARELLLSFCPARARHLIPRVRHRAAETILHFLKTYGVLMLITFGELCLGFLILNLLGAGIKYVVPLALIISLVDILPVLGVGTVLVPWALAVLISGNSRLCIMLLALFAVMSVVRNILESRLMGSRFGLHPAATLLALYVGGKWFGILGFFLMPFICIVLLQLHRDSAHEEQTA